MKIKFVLPSFALSLGFSTFASGQSGDLTAQLPVQDEKLSNERS